MSTSKKDIQNILKMPELHYQLSGNEAQYDASIGTLIVDRVLRNDTKVFRLPSGSLAQFPKTLVLCDPTIIGWPASKRQHVKECLEELIKAGFQIYGLDKLGLSVDTNQTVEELTQENPNQTTLLHRTSDELIQSNLELKNKPAMQVGVLDTYLINRMLGLAFDEYILSDTLAVDVAEVAEMCQEKGIELTLLHQILKHNNASDVTYVVREMGLKEFAGAVIVRDTSVSLNMPTKHLEFLVEKFNVNIFGGEDFIKDLDILIESKLLSREGIELVIPSKTDRGHQLFDRFACAKIKTLTFEEADFADLNYDFSKIKNISNLKFNKCKNIELILPRLQHLFHGLLKLEIEGSDDLTGAALGNALDQMPELENFALTDHHGMALRDLPANIKIKNSKIKKYNIRKSRYLLKNLIGFFKTTASDVIDYDFTESHEVEANGMALRKMQYVVGKGPRSIAKENAGYYRFSSFRGNAVENLDLNVVSIPTGIDMNSCMENMPLLKKLDTGKKNLEQFKFSDNFNFDKLETLLISGEHMTSGKIENFLSYTSRLKHWSVKIGSRDGLTPKTAESLSELETFVGEEIFDMRMVYDVMEYSPKLKTFAVEKMRSLSDCTQERVFTSPSIESLTLQLQFMHPLEATCLLNAAVNVKHLNMLNAHKIAVEKLNHQALQHVERWQLTGNASEFLPQMINRMPLLKELCIELHGGHHLRKSDVLLNKALALQKFSIIGKHPGLHENVIYQFIEASPHLKYLQINVGLSVFSQHTALPRELNFDNLEILDISDSNFLTRDDLYKLLLRAPKLRELRIRNRRDLDNFVLPPGLTNLKLISAEGVYFDHDVTMKMQQQLKGGFIQKVEIKAENHLESSLTAKAFQTDVNTEIDSKPRSRSGLIRNKQGQIINPIVYRRSATNKISKKSGLFKRGESPFIHEITGDPEFQPCPGIDRSQINLGPVFDGLKEGKSEHVLHAKMQLHLSTTPQALPSLDCPESISHLSIPGLDPREYEIRYSQRDDLYYIQLLKDQAKDLTVEYILHTSKERPKLSQELSQIIYEYFESKITRLPDSMKEGDADYWIRNLIQTRGGRCRQKVVAFYYEIEHKVYKRRLIWSEDHVWLEVQEKKGSPWVKCDLGGYPAEIKVDNGLFTQAAIPVTTALQETKKQRQYPPNPAFVERSPTSQEHPKAYAFHLLSQHSGQNVLVDLKNNASVSAFQKLIREVARDESRPIFYIDSPDDIRCHTSRLVRNDKGEVTMEKGAGGDLYEHLTKSHQQNPILLVNWNNFTPEEIVRFNTLIEKNERREADKIPISKNMTVIGLYNSHRKDAYRGSDFTSRSDNYFEPNFEASTIVEASEPNPIPPESTVFQSVYLHHSEDWQNLLCGRWELSHDGWKFNEGPFIKALTAGSLILHDAPWKDPDFVKFMDRVRIEKSVEIGGKKYPIPKEFYIKEGEPYQLAEQARNKVTISELATDRRLPENIKVLNPVTFSDFFHRYDIDNKKIVSQNGWLDTPEDFKIYLSHEITQAQWGQLVEAAGERKLTLLTAPGVVIPDALKVCKTADPVLIQGTHSPVLKVIECNTKDAVMPGIMIDCTNMTIADLFESKIKIEKQGPFDFEHKTGFVNQALYGDEPLHIVLTGTPSQEVLQYLTQWAATAKPCSKNASLTLLTDKPLPALLPVSDYQKINYPRKPKFQAYHFIEDDSYDLIEYRTRLIHSAMYACPLTLIEGVTGVGKSTFILDHLRKQQGINMAVGLGQIDAWLSDPDDDETKILFIDEANITEEQKQDWTQFASMLMNKPPYVVINGKLKKLSDQHKVIFAGNPQSYGAERHLPALYKNYSISRVIFKPLNRQFILESVLEPILGKKHEANKIFMDMYDKLIQMAGSEIWITPRDMEHMAHLYLIHGNAAQCAHVVAKAVIPADKQLLYPDQLPDLSLPSPQALKGHLITESRRNVESRINEFLKIRQMKIEGKITGGLGGILLEGDPGTGKSEQVIAQLKAQGLEKSFYRITSRQSCSEQKEILTQAYREGAIVLIDEINSFPAMEKFFNDALSGKLECEGDVKPGFLLIGTQNPVSFEGRRELSLALLKRLFVQPVSKYSEAEMIEILVKEHGVAQPIAREILYDFTREPHSFRMLDKKYASAIPYIIDTLKDRAVDMTHKDLSELFYSLAERIQPDENRKHNVVGKTLLPGQTLRVDDEHPLSDKKGYTPPVF